MKHQELFNYLSEEHGVILLENELQEVVRIVEREKKSPIVDINRCLIDISKVVIVGPNGGDPDNVRYLAIFQNGKEVEVHESRKCLADGTTLNQLPRAEFIALWKEHLSY